MVIQYFFYLVVMVISQNSEAASKNYVIGSVEQEIVVSTFKIVQISLSFLY